MYRIAVYSGRRLGDRSILFDNRNNNFSFWINVNSRTRSTHRIVRENSRRVVRTRAVLVPVVAVASQVREAGADRAGRLLPFRVGSRRFASITEDGEWHRYLSGSFVKKAKESLMSKFNVFISPIIQVFRHKGHLLAAPQSYDCNCYVSRPLFSKLHAPADAEVTVVKIWFTLLNFKIYSVRCPSVASFTYLREDCSVARWRRAGWLQYSAHLLIEDYYTFDYYIVYIYIYMYWAVLGLNGGLE